MDEEIKEILDNHEERIRKLEMVPSIKIKKQGKMGQRTGIPKGIQELIEANFFDSPKNIKKILEELKKNGYFASIQTIDAAVRKDFFKSKRILTRIKGNAGWEYVIRK